MSNIYRVELTKDYLVFSAAHFITYAGDICERLHGHNYRVRAELEGPLDENHYVIDFIHFRDVLQSLILELDHRMLLPTTHPMIRVAPHENEVEVTFQDRRWVFPREDCVLLPIANTTTELLAKYLGDRLLANVLSQHGPVPTQLTVGVDENYGQWGICEIRPGE